MREFFRCTKIRVYLYFVIVAPITYTDHKPITQKDTYHTTPYLTHPSFPIHPLLLHTLYQLQYCILNLFWHNCIQTYSLYQFSNTDQGSQSICMDKNMQEFIFRIKVKYAAVQFEDLCMKRIQLKLGAVSKIKGKVTG